MSLFLLLFSAVAQAGWVLDDYQSFRDGGCDAESEGIYSPVVLRVLRSTPWALAGKDFRDEDLPVLFAADGDWYRARPGRSVEVAAKDSLCVAKIREWEDHQRQMHCVEKAAQSVITSRLDLYRWHRQDGGLIELHRYIRGMVPEDRPLRSACRVSEMTREISGGRWVEWSFSVDTVRRPSVALLLADYHQLYPEDERGEPSADYVDRMKRWERQTVPVERVEWSADQLEGNPGDELFRRNDRGICWGTGVFMGPTWFCMESGSF